MRTSLSTLPPVVLSTTVLFVMRSRAWAGSGTWSPACGLAREQVEDNASTRSSA